jgi:hypothetical protein
MANDLTRRGVIMLDTVADNIIAAGTPVHVWKARLTHPTAAGVADIGDAGGSVSLINLAAGAGGADAIEFYNKPFKLNGLRLIALAAGAQVWLYITE